MARAKKEAEPARDPRNTIAIVCGILSGLSGHLTAVESGFIDISGRCVRAMEEGAGLIAEEDWEYLRQLKIKSVARFEVIREDYHRVNSILEKVRAK